MCWAACRWTSRSASTRIPAGRPWSPSRTAVRRRYTGKSPARWPPASRNWPRTTARRFRKSLSKTHECKDWGLGTQDSEERLRRCFSPITHHYSPFTRSHEHKVGQMDPPHGAGAGHDRAVRARAGARGQRQEDRFLRHLELRLRHPLLEGLQDFHQYQFDDVGSEELRRKVL